MVAALEYSCKKQAKLVNAICALHNFICAYDPEDGDVNFAADVEQTTLWARSMNSRIFWTLHGRGRDRVGIVICPLTN